MIAVVIFCLILLGIRYLANKKPDIEGTIKNLDADVQIQKIKLLDPNRNTL
jgi:hypothetical protein